MCGKRTKLYFFKNFQKKKKKHLYFCQDQFRSLFSDKSIGDLTNQYGRDLKLVENFFCVYANIGRQTSARKKRKKKTQLSFSLLSLTHTHILMQLSLSCLFCLASTQSRMKHVMLKHPAEYARLTKTADIKLRPANGTTTASTVATCTVCVSTHVASVSTTTTTTTTEIGSTQPALNCAHLATPPSALNATAASSCASNNNSTGSVINNSSSGGSSSTSSVCGGEPTTRAAHQSAYSTSRILSVCSDVSDVSEHDVDKSLAASPAEQSFDDMPTTEQSGEQTASTTASSTFFDSATLQSTFRSLLIEARAATSHSNDKNRSCSDADNSSDTKRHPNNDGISPNDHDNDHDNDDDDDYASNNSSTSEQRTKRPTAAEPFAMISGRMPHSCLSTRLNLNQCHTRTSLLSHSTTKETTDTDDDDDDDNDDDDNQSNKNHTKNRTKQRSQANNRSLNHNVQNHIDNNPILGIYFEKQYNCF